MAVSGGRRKRNRKRNRKRKAILILITGLFFLTVITMFALWAGMDHGKPVDPASSEKASKTSDVIKLDDESIRDFDRKEENDGRFRSQIQWEPDYSRRESWAYFPDDTHDKEDDKPADVFYVASTSVPGSDEHTVMDMDDDEQRNALIGAVGLQKGIYDDRARFYSPFYRQMALAGYYPDFDPGKRDKLLDAAYEDISGSFMYYLENYNNGRPFVLAGSSQGADMIKRLMMDDAFSGQFEDKMVAAYVIGWRITDGDLKKLRKAGIDMAQGELDTGVIVSFCSEDVSLDHTFIVPEKTHGINPINWRTDSTRAGADENPGSCLELGYDSSIKKEVGHRCGAYLDDKRGTLKVTGERLGEFYPDLGCTVEGDYHVWDSRLFYRSLERNVQERIAVFIGLEGDEIRSFPRKSESREYTDFSND